MRIYNKTQTVEYRQKFKKLSEQAGKGWYPKKSHTTRYFSRTKLQVMCTVSGRTGRNGRYGDGIDNFDGDVSMDIANATDHSLPLYARTFVGHGGYCALCGNFTRG